MPVKDAGPGLEALLSAIRGQGWAGRAELVAVDSGSTDSTVETLRDFGATVLTVDPGDFDHGLTRLAATRHAHGQLLVFVTQSMRPAGPHWLGPLVKALDDDPRIAGVSSRLVPHEDADPLTRLDGLREVSYSTEPSLRAIDDRARYEALSPDELRSFAHFHTVSCAIRPEALARVPFRSVTTIGEDLQWGKDALEAGLAIAHEPRSVARHSHAYGFDELLGRNFDDGVATRELVGRRLSGESLLGHIAAQVDADLAHLRGEYELGPEELEHWECESISRRTAQLVGQWLGNNADRLPAQAVPALSLARRRTRS
jgi:rhamnosyltransferase